MSRGLLLGKSRVGEALLHGVEQGRVARVVEVGPEHHPDALRMEGVDQLAELCDRSVILVDLCVIQRIVAVIAVMREVVDGAATRHPAMNLLVNVGHPHHINAQVGEIAFFGFL